MLYQTIKHREEEYRDRGCEVYRPQRKPLAKNKRCHLLFASNMAALPFIVTAMKWQKLLPRPKSFLSSFRDLLKTALARLAHAHRESLKSSIL